MVINNEPRMKDGKIINQILIDELKVIQMDILSAIDDFCKKNHIRYSMSCGTLLGAVRHKGYIPWDDDIDIYLPREDYKRLIDNFPEVYMGNVKIASLERDSIWERPYAKAYDDRTILQENVLVKGDIGVNIDIFPIDDVPDDDSEWQTYDRWRRFLQKMYLMKYLPIKKERGLIKNGILYLVRILTWFYTRRKWSQKLDRLAQKYNGKGYHRCFECCQGLYLKRPFSKKLFDNLIDIQFEDRCYKAYADYDAYLRNGYGDYMQLPPEEKRVPHHDFIAYWK